ncbi:MAG TPA: hypothetical protein VE956_23210 [Nodularia sp. (in: cyanobacteria)]|nr:hypothetical protein [Nodularia sp. (in: cyanobacteria)]
MLRPCFGDRDRVCFALSAAIARLKISYFSSGIACENITASKYSAM